MTEMWIEIRGYEGYYEVSSIGRVRSKKRKVGHRSGSATRKGKTLQPRSDKDGYLFVSLSRDGKSVNSKIHRLVASHFLPPYEGSEVNHQDFDKANNAYLNLEWSNRKLNQEHASAGGRFSGSENPRRAKKIDRDMADMIRKEREAGATYSAIGAKFGVSAPTALKIVRGDIWK